MMSRAESAASPRSEVWLASSSLVAGLDACASAQPAWCPSTSLVRHAGALSRHGSIGARKLPTSDGSSSRVTSLSSHRNDRSNNCLSLTLRPWPPCCKSRTFRRILPAAVREPVRVEPRTVTNDAFVPDGSYPMTPRDPISRSWGSYTNQGGLARGRFESLPIESCQSGSSLQFHVAGSSGLRRQYLAAKDLQSGREQKVEPGKLAGEGWMSAVVTCPTGPYAIVAVDATVDDWPSFREPVEVGRASRMVEWLIALSPALIFIGLGLEVVTTAAREARRRLGRMPWDPYRVSVRDRS